MIARKDLLRQTVSVWISALLLVMSVAIPALERAEVSHELAVESEHDPAHCPPAHDHTVCTQVVSNLSAPTPPVAAEHTHAVVRLVAPVQAVPAVRSALAEGHPSRAPPAI